MTESAINSAPPVPSRTRSRAAFLGVIAAFVGPLVLAYVLLMYMHWAPASHTNNGSLIEPAVAVGNLEAELTAGGLIPSTYWDGHWTLVFYADAACDLYCEAALFKARQIRLALGRDAPRVHRLHLAASAAAALPAGLASEHPGLERAQLSGSAGAFAGLAPGALYLVDPMGNVILRYDDTTTSKGLMKDLKRLLKVSKVG